MLLLLIHVGRILEDAETWILKKNVEMIKDDENVQKCQKDRVWLYL